MRTTVARLLAALAVAALAVAAPLLLGGLASPATAHASLVSSDPEAGATLDTLPGEVSLTFSQGMRAPAYVVVTGPGGDVAAAEPVIDGAVVSQELGTGPAGDYTLSYRVVSDDGHPVTSTIDFTVTTGTGDAAGGTPSTDGAGGGTGAGTGGSADEGGAADGTDAAQAAAGTSGSGSDEAWWTRHSDHVFMFGGLVLAAGALLFVALRRGEG